MWELTDLACFKRSLLWFPKNRENFRTLHTKTSRLDSMHKKFLVSLTELRITIKSRNLHSKTTSIFVHLYAPLFFILSHLFWFGFLRFFRVPINDSYNIDNWYAGRWKRKKRKFCTSNYLSLLQGYVKPILKNLLAISGLI